MKWDGYRVAVHVELGGKVRILARGRHDWTDRFPTLAKAVSELGPGTMILDGEAVILDEQARSDFDLLVASLGGRGGTKVSSDTVLYAFDLLYLDGHDISMLSLEERRMLLDPLLSNASSAIRLSEMFETDRTSLFSSAAELASKESLRRGSTRPTGRAVVATGARSNAFRPTPSSSSVTSLPLRSRAPSTA